VGWKKLGNENIAPRYPAVFINGINGKDDQDAILYLWGKKGPPQ